MRALRTAWIAALVMAGVLAFPADANKNASPLTPELRKAVRAAEAIFERGDPGTSAIAMEAVASHADFGALEANERSAYLLRAAWLATEARDMPRAHRLAQAAVDAEGNDPDAWFLLGQLAADQGQDETAARALAHLASTWPALVGHLRTELVNPLLHRLGVTSPQTLELLEALYAADWTVDGIEPDHAWARLALMRADRGDHDGARAALAGVTSATVITWLRSDRRFDALIKRDDPRYEPRKAAAAEVDTLRGRAAGSPSSLALQRELAYSLLVAGRPGEALALAEQALADPGRFDDTDDLHWMANQRAIALRRLSRTDEALAALTAAAAMDESGQANVSQTLNLGTLLVDMERPEQALAAIARVDGMSGYGLLVQSMVRLRAYRQMGRDDDAAIWLQRIRDGRDEGTILHLEALLLAGHEDEAANWLAELLDDPDRRAEALAWCQDYLGSEPLAGRVPLREARASLLARSDVLAAVNAVGRIEDTGIHDIVGID
ncbi:tetratricopeptide repeat protein [Luteimonas arsenica]|uniref:tetratricopeptide repeat protein n=1 Tax=Luteimonas arsenica TaxID=1586242 RepID=UPI0010541D78|nr:tetratricopeptide repeat protein [Luteimonas arsenica]